MLGVQTVPAQSKASGDAVSLTIEGFPGIFRGASAFSPPYGRLLHSTYAGYFSRKGLTYEGEDHRGLEGRYAFLYRPWEDGVMSGFGISLGAEARSYKLSSADGDARSTTIGNLSLGGHYPVWRSDTLAVAIGAPVFIYARPGGGVEPNSISPGVFLAASLRSGGPGAFLRQEMIFNVGYQSDRSNAVIEQSDVDVNRRTRLAQGVFAESSYTARIGYVATLWGGDVAPFLEIAYWRDADGEALDTLGEKLKLDGPSHPLLVTPGARALVFPGLQAQAAVDLGYLTGKFPEENEIVPPWKVWIGLTWSPPAGRSIRADVYSLYQKEEVPTREIAALFVGTETPVRKPAPVAAPRSLPEPVETRYEHRIYFPRNGTAVPEEDRPILDALAMLLEKNRDVKLRVEGHADRSGPEFVNERISFDRALKVVDYLEGKGVARKRLVPVALADSRPLSTDAGNGLDAGDRRAEFVIFKPSEFRIEFESGRWDVLPEAVSVLDRVHAVLNESPGLTLRVEGHTDDLGWPAMNAQLAKARARAAADYLIRKGVPPEKVQVDSFGEFRPIEWNTELEGRALNRRVDIFFTSGVLPAAR